MNEILILFTHAQLFLKGLKKSYRELENKLDYTEKKFGRTNKLKQFISIKLANTSLPHMISEVINFKFCSFIDNLKSKYVFFFYRTPSK